MNIQDKPDYKIFASAARSGEVTTFPDILRGWGVTIDKTEEIPPMEWFNAIGKRTDEWLLYLTQRGIPEWDSSLDYPKSAVVTHGDVIYISLKASKGEQPDRVQAAWGTMASFLGLDNKLDKSAVVQSTGQSTTNVMSQKAVSDAISKSATYPIGAPIPWPQATAPSGFLVCNGQSFNKTSYPLLASAYPSGVLPDLRGEFIRGLDAGRNIDSGRAALSAQGDAIRNIKGSLNLGLLDKLSAGGAFKKTAYTEGSGGGIQGFNKTSAEFDASLVVPTANENRPRNIAFLYIVRAA